MTKLSEKQIEKMEANGFNRWTKGDYDRMYFNIEDTDAMDVERYNTGNISYAELNGKEISHAEAGRILAVKAYVDVATGEVVVNGHNEEAEEIVKEEIEKVLNAINNGITEDEAKEEETMTYTIYEGDKATINGTQLTFDCEPDDIDTAYDILAEEIHLNDQSEDSQDLIDFQNAKDDDVKTLLDDMQRMGFIDSWEVEDQGWLR